MDKIPVRVVMQNLFNSGGGDLKNISWSPFHEGIEIHQLYGVPEDGASAALLRYAPGARVPKHKHKGFEHILVLEGSQQDEQAAYLAGTLLINGPGSGHSVASKTGCIVLAIWEKPVDMQSYS